MELQQNQLNDVISIFSDNINKFAIGTDPRLLELDKIKSFAKRVEFCKNNFKRIASGTSRIVFDYDANFVLKLAKNQKGISQNALENDGFMQRGYGGDVIAKIESASIDDKWILVQKAYKINDAKFKNLTGFELSDLYKFLEYKISHNKRFDFYFKQNAELTEQLSESEFVNQILDMTVNFQMLPGDIAKINSWGEANGKALLVDYGLSKDVYENHYAR